MQTTYLMIQTIEDVTRRTFITGALAAAFLIACGDSDDDEVADPTATLAGPTTRVVETPLGPVEVPVRPERVVVFDRRGTLAYLIDLGVTPVGAMSASSIYGSKFHPLLSGTEKVEALDWQAPDLEKVAAMRPDLIIGSRADVEKVHAQLKAMAPTVAVQLDLNNPQKELTDLGKVLGMEDRAVKLLSDFDADVAKAKAKIGRSGSVSIILPLQDNVRVYRGDDFAGQLVKALGQTMTPDISKLTPSTSPDIATVSFEQVNMIDGETLVVLVNLAADQVTLKNNLFTLPTFKALPAVRAGKVVEIESQANFGTAGLKGQRQILEALAKAFAS